MKFYFSEMENDFSFNKKICGRQTSLINCYVWSHIDKTENPRKPYFRDSTLST